MTGLSYIFKVITTKTVTMLKFPKDGRTTVRFSTERLKALGNNKETGEPWTVQEVLDWAFDQRTEVKVEVSSLNGKASKKKKK
jgi:hypothetical protein